MTRVPTIFVSHGPPTLAIDNGPTVAFFKRLGAEFERPTSILCISAHWETAAPAVSTAESPQMIYDFYGFPEALYQMTYPAPGAAHTARKAAASLSDAGLSCAVDPSQGFDHGCWVPLMVMYPEADIPVAQLSIQPDAGPAHHLEVGKALAPLRDEGVLILGSGNVTHNLQDALGNMRAGTSNPPTPKWAAEFDDWVTDKVVSGDTEALINYRQRAPHAVQAHPRDEHFLPLFTNIGAANGGTGRQIHAEFMFGSLSMAAYAFD